MPSSAILGEACTNYVTLCHNDTQLYQKAYEEHYKPVIKILNSITSQSSSPSDPISKSPSLPAGAHVLDVGCGQGTPVASLFVEKGIDITGIDMMAPFIEEAKTELEKKRQNHNQKLLLIHTEMLKFEPPPGETYDLILAVHLFYHTPVAEIKTMLLRFVHWLKPGGLVFIVSSFPEEFQDRKMWAEDVQLHFLGHFYTHVTVGSPEAWRKVVTDVGLEILQSEDNVYERAFDGELGGGNDTQVCLLARKLEVVGEDATAFNPFHGPFPLVPREHIGPDVDHAGCKAIYAHMDVNRILNDVGVVLKEKNVTSVGYIGLDLFNIDQGNKWNDNITTYDLNSESNLSSDPTALLFFWAFHRRHLLTHFEELSQKLGKHFSQVKTIITVQAAPDSEVFHLMNDAMHGLPFHPFHHGYILHFMEKRFKEMGFGKVKYVTSEGVFRFGEKEGVTDLEGKIQNAVALLAGAMKQPDAQDEEGLKNIKAFRKNLEGLTRALFSHSNGVVRSQTVLMIAEKEA